MCFPRQHLMDILNVLIQNSYTLSRVAYAFGATPGRQKAAEAL